MDESNGDATSEEELRRVVFGHLPLPADTVEVGEFEDTPHGKMRLLEFPAAYQNPLQDEDGEWVQQEVRLVGLQSESGRIGFGVRILMSAAHLDPDAASEVAAAIKGAAANAQRNNDDPQSSERRES